MKDSGFLDTLFDFCPEDVLFLGGYFNCTELNLDRNHNIEPHLASHSCLIHIIKQYELCNI